MTGRLSVATQAKDWEEETQTRPISREAITTESGVWKVPAEAPSEAPPALTRVPTLAPPQGSKSRSLKDIFGTYGPIVRRIALRAVRSLPRTLTIDDIVSAGWVGMSEALKRRPEEMPEDQFEAYACYRVRGAILDYLRAIDPLSRRLRGIAREIQAAQRDLTNSLGRAPQQDELARRLGMPLAQLQRTSADIQEAGMEHLDVNSGFEAPSGEPSPEYQASQNEMMKTIGEQMKLLPERLQVVLSLHYQHECSLREIGEILGVTESRVCQLHAEAVQRIRGAIDGHHEAPQRRSRRRIPLIG